MNPLGVFLIAVYSLPILFGSRRVALLGLIAGVCYMTQGQSVTFAGFNMTAVRILELVGMIRILGRKEVSWNLNAIDKSLILYVLAISVTSMIREGGAVVAYNLGFIYNALLSYIMVRSLVTNLDEFVAVLNSLAFLILPLAFLFAFEFFTHRNLFSVLGGVSPDVWFRDGSPRCMGPFRNPITGGSFGATVAPLFIGLIFSKAAVRAGWIGLGASTIIVVFAHSSGPLLAYLAGIFGLLLWRFRGRLSFIRRSSLLALIFLHLIMKAPVWFLLGRVSDLIGGGGYYRAELIDVFIRRFSSWWLMGTSDTTDWMPTTVLGSADITNQFIADGLNGGLLGFSLGVLCLVCCFRALGRSLLEARNVAESREKMLWCVGVALFLQIVNQSSVTYFDQMYVMWYLVLAAIASATSEEVRLDDPESETDVSLAQEVLSSP